MSAPIYSAEKYPGQRTKEKRELFRRFKFRVIEDLYKQRFFSLFNNCCFKCGRPEKDIQEIGHPPILCMDHHIPMALGGHLIPGNVVALCRDCNNRKLDKAPACFYSNEELLRLQPLLDAQANLFAFSFDWDQWNENREGYLLSMGVDQATVNAALHDENHPNFVGLGP